MNIIISITSFLSFFITILKVKHIWYCRAKLSAIKLIIAEEVVSRSNDIVMKPGIDGDIGDGIYFHGQAKKPSMLRCNRAKYSSWAAMVLLLAYRMINDYLL